MVPTVLQSFLGSLTEIFSSAVSWMAELLTFVTSHPVILVPILVFFVSGGVIGLVMRILRG